MKVLVTGGCGFIGSNLVQELWGRTWKIDVADYNLSRLHEWNEKVPGVNFYIKDYTDDFILNKVKSQEYDVIFHLAAIPRVSYSVDHPSLTNDENIGKTVKLLEAAKGNCKRFIFSSSSSVYGGSDTLPTPESVPVNPQSPYALQKSTVEIYLKLFSKLYNMDCVSLRYFNVFGPRQYADNAYASVISSWLKAVKTGEKIRLDGDGHQTRDFCYVSNVVRANLLAAISANSFSGETINIGCGGRISLNEILEKVLDIKKLYIVRNDSRAGDVKNSQADISLAKKLLNYEPHIYFEDGFKRTLEWWMNDAKI